MDLMNTYLETLSGYVYDDDKVVTYKWLSKELEIHVNIAKQILREFWQNHKAKGDIQSTVMLIGNLKSGGLRVEVVRESSLSTAKEKFNKILSEHLYSIQKSLADLELLAISGEGDVKFSAVKCNESVKRTDEELSKLRWGTLFKDYPSMNVEETLKPVIESKKESISHETIVKHETDTKSVSEKKTLVSQKTGFTNLFGKSINKEKKVSSDSSGKTSSLKESDNKEKVSSNEKKQTSKKTQKGGLASFFEKSINQKKDKDVKSINEREGTANLREKNASNIETSTFKNIDKPKEDTDEEKSDVVARSVNETNRNKNNITSQSVNKSTESKRGKKRNLSHPSKNVIKKRKRIIVESDSNDSESRSETEDIEPSRSPSPEIVTNEKTKSPTPPRIIKKDGKARVLKLVDETYEEDGFLVTKKVHVYKSCSEDEVDIVKPKEPKKVEAKPETKTKKKNKNDVKQTTLTNFFKKS